MKKHFYSHLVEVESLYIELDSMDLSRSERWHLTSLIDSTLHYTILDVVMSELSHDDKKEFLKHVASHSHDNVWNLLKGKVENIEEKIKKTIAVVKEELARDIQEAKEKK